MFGAIGRLFRSMWLFIIGKTDAATDEISRNPSVVKARYEDIIREKTKRIQQYQQAVAGLMAQQEKKMVSLRELTEEVEKLEKLRAGALAKAKERVGQLEGKSKEEIHQDADYLRCLSAYKDFSSTLDEKQKRINEIETDVEDSRSRVKDHKMMLEELMREIEKLRAEKHDAVAEVISTREEKQIADTISGISEDQTSEELQQLREMRATLRAEGKVAREMAGTDAKSQEAEFLEYAGKGQGDEEFDALIGLAGETDKGPSEPEERERSEESKLPE